MMSTVGLQSYFKQKLEGPPFSPGEEYKYEAVRIGTFVGWPSEYTARPSYLARTGLYWTHDGDEVKCFSCDASLRGCVSGGTLDAAHRREIPRCRFLAGTDEGNVMLLPPAMNKLEAEKGLPIIPIPSKGILADIITSHVARRKPDNQPDSAFLRDVYLKYSHDNREENDPGQDDERTQIQQLHCMEITIHQQQQGSNHRSLQEGPELGTCGEMVPGVPEVPSVQIQEQAPAQVHQVYDTPQDDSSAQEAADGHGRLADQLPNTQQQQQQQQQQPQQQQARWLSLAPSGILHVLSVEGVAECSDNVSP